MVVNLTTIQGHYWHRKSIGKVYSNDNITLASTENVRELLACLAIWYLKAGSLGYFWYPSADDHPLLRFPQSVFGP